MLKEVKTMCAEEKKDKGEKAGCADFGCKPEDFMKMFGKMGKCFPGEEGVTDFSAAMKKMMGKCCVPAKENTEDTRTKS
jgi:hypothetical protein